MIVDIETKGTNDCSKAPGQSGEVGCHQFLPSTWRLYSREVFGEVVKQTPENAYHVTVSMIEKWLDQGLSDRQIFLIWNQGNPGKCKAGINRHGVRYDSCAYADKALRLLQSLSTAQGLTDPQGVK